MRSATASRSKVAFILWASSSYALRSDGSSWRNTFRKRRRRDSTTSHLLPQPSHGGCLPLGPVRSRSRLAPAPIEGRKEPRFKHGPTPDARSVVQIGAVHADRLAKRGLSLKPMERLGALQVLLLLVREWALEEPSERAPPPSLHDPCGDPARCGMQAPARAGGPGAAELVSVDGHSPTLGRTLPASPSSRRRSGHHLR